MGEGKAVMVGRLRGIARRARPAQPMEAIESVQVGLDGIEGEKRHGKRRLVTLISQEDWSAACAQLGAELPWTTRRANLLVEGLHLQETTGSRVRIGEALLEVTEETDPCQRMDEAHAGLRAALVPGWRGGVRCQVIEPGQIRVGDDATLLD